MKSYIYIILVAVFSSGCYHGQPAQRISTEATSFDAGGIVADKSSDLVHIFTLRNSASRPVKILGIDKMCGCLDATIDLESVAPGQEVELKLSARVSPAYSPRRAATCIVKTDDPTKAAVPYSLIFETFPRIRFRPLALRLSWPERAGTPVEDGIGEAEAWLDTFRARGEETDSPAQFRVPDGLSVEIRGEPTSDEPARGVIRTSYPLRVRSLPDRLGGKFGPQQLDVSVLTRRGERGSLLVTWTRRSSVDASPSHIHFGTLSGPIAGPTTVTVRSTEDRAFRILSVAGDDSATVMPADAELNQYGPVSPLRTAHPVRFRIRLTNPRARAAAGTITFITDDESCPKTSVFWSAFLDSGDSTRSVVDRGFPSHTRAQGDRP